MPDYDPVTLTDVGKYERSALRLSLPSSGSLASGHSGTGMHP